MAKPTTPPKMWANESYDAYVSRVRTYEYDVTEEELHEMATDAMYTRRAKLRRGEEL